VGKQMARGAGLKIFLVGRVALEADGLAVQDARLPGRQGRLLFAYLAVQRGRPVPRDELAAALWGEAPPATWDKALTVLVSKLRSLLTEAGLDGPHALTAAFGCYRLELPEGTWIDAVAAADAADEAERALAAGDPAAAKTAALLAESLTRRAFLPGDNGTWVEDKRRELAGTRSRAVTVLADACLRTGAEAKAASWAEQAIELEPFRETGYRLLMEAHAATGNRAEALRVYERCRRLLAEELGAYPSPETESVYQRLLQAPPAPKRRPPERPAPGQSSAAGRGRSLARPRLLAVTAALAVLVATGIVAGVAATSGGQKQVAIPANSVVALDPNGSVTTALTVGARPVAAVAAADSLWVANLDDRTVTRINLSSRRIQQSIPIGGAPTALAATPGAVWVSDNTGQISRIDPEYNRPAQTRQLVADTSLRSRTAWPMLAASGSIWIVDPDGYVAQIDPGSGRQTGTVDVGNEPSAVAAGAGSLWVTNSADGTVTRIDPATLVATPIPVGHGPDAVAVNAAGVWVANAGDDALVRINPDTGAVAATARVGDGPAAVLSTATALWVANARDGTVMRLDPRSGTVTKTIHLGGSPTALVSAAGQVWVTVAPAPAPPPVTGGTAHFTMQDDFSSLDPAQWVLYNSEIFYATCANLVTYPDKPGPAGWQIVPEVAEAVPTPTDGGRTYSFTVRSGFRFSPPSNEAVTAQTFKATIERVASPKVKSSFASDFSGIVGYHDYATGKAPGLSGVVARGNTLTITLSQPDGSFLANLAGGAACAVPAGTPPVPGLPDIPSAGPYYIASYSPRQQLVLRRNPNYRGDRPHHLDQMVFTIGIDSARALAEIEAGTADYAVDGLPRDAGPGLESQYGPGSKAARAGHQQYFISPANGTRLLFMNTSRPLFSNVRLRRAVNYAIDRPALAAQSQRFAEVNPYGAGSPADDYMPPSIAGATSSHLYPLAGPDLRRARQLAGNVHATAIMYTPDVPPWLQEAQIIRSDLQPLGIDVQLKEFSVVDFLDQISHRGEPFDLAVAAGDNITTDPTQVLEGFDGSTITADGNSNLSYLNDPAFDQQLHAAAVLSGARRYRTYSQLALELEHDLAPAAAFATTASRDFFSARMGCQLYQTIYGIDLAALCLRGTGS
jgi:ABC-type transport system substrate-binding protein/DNA-binding SARP family transcriptional activator